MNDIMIDLETWGLVPGCAIRSIGAVVFDMENQQMLGQTFYRNVDKESCLGVDMVVDKGTEEWWERQSMEAQASFLIPYPVNIYAAFDEFTSWFLQNGTTAGAVRVWSHGAGFDLPILRWTAQRLGRKVPWHYQNERDTRTLFMMAKEGDPVFFDQHIKSFSQGVNHHALDDAITQAKQVCMGWASII
jgi:hypothetical protein